MSVDKMTWEGIEYELATKTVKIVKLIEAAESAGSMYEAYRRQWEMVQEAIGTDVAKELLGTGNFEEMDLNTVVTLYNAVIMGYDRRVMEARRLQEEEALNSPVFSAVKDMAAQVKTIESAGRNRR